jgi:hypothetical protein
MATKLIFGILAGAFAVLAAVRWVRVGRRRDPAVATWAIIALIFGAVAVVLSR